MTIQDVTINDSVVLLSIRAEETTERVLHATNLHDAVGRLQVWLAVMSEVALESEKRLKQAVKRARVEGRAQAMAESLTRLQDAERRRREVQERLEQVKKERDRALELMHEAQRQELNARNELEEQRRKAHLDESLTKIRPEAAEASGTVREEAYESLIETVDAELGDFRTQLAQLSVELEESSGQGLSTQEANSAQWRKPSGSVQQSSVGPSPPLTSLTAIDAEAGADEFALTNLDADGFARKPGKRRTVSSVLLRVLGLLGFALDGISVNIMANSPVGPAIVWQVVYTLVAFVVALLYAAMFRWIFLERTFRLGVFAGLLVLIATIIFPSRSLPGLGPLAHWLVYKLGPM
jgi:hypothetical protein